MSGGPSPHLSPACQIDSALTASLSDPFEAYQTRLTARLARQDQSDEAHRVRDEARKEREKDRTTWLGTDLGEKGTKIDQKRKDLDIGVGKYMGAPGRGAVGGGVGVEEYGVEKKRRKAGGFGDFAGW